MRAFPFSTNIKTHVVTIGTKRQPTAFKQQNNRCVIEGQRKGGNEEERASFRLAITIQ